jgi:rhodanese-related sulfurtransferase
MINEVAQPPKTVTPGELHRLLAAGSPAELLDVRTPAEHAAAHVPGAKLVPVGELDAMRYLRDRAPGERPIYVLCQSGFRARRAVEKFHEAGFDGCVRVEGGMQAWIDAGLPVERSVSKVLPLMQQVQVAVGFISAVGAALALAINPWFALVPLATGCGLVFAGLTGHCGLALLLAKMPWNRSPKCDTHACCAIP